MDLNSLTVIVPTKNEAANIGRFIDTVPAGVDLIIVDASTDKTRDIIRGRKRGSIRLLKCNGNIAAARQLAADTAQTEWLLFSDADVVFAETYFEKLASIHPDIGCGALVGSKLSRGRFRYYYRLFSVWLWLCCALGLSAGSGSNMLVRRRALMQVGGFDCDLSCNEDTDLIWRLRRSGYRVDFKERLKVYEMDHRRLDRGVVFKTGHSLIRCALLYGGMRRVLRSSDWGYWRGSAAASGTGGTPPTRPLDTLRFSGEMKEPPNELSAATRLLEYALGLNSCRAIYRDCAHLDDPRQFMQALLKRCRILPDCAAQDKSKIPPKGPCVVVANHPHGAIEGIVLADLLLSIRLDVKIMVNYLLDRIPQFKDLSIAVDPFDRATATRYNIGPLRSAITWVRNGGLLLVFPAGEVSHYHLSRREVADPPWSRAVARIIRCAKASVVPIYFTGCNSALFHIAGFVHPRLRTILLARELLNKQGTRIPFTIGNAIGYRWLGRYADEDQLTAYLRWRTYAIGHNRHRASKFRAVSGRSAAVHATPVAKPQDAELLRREVAALSPQQRLVQSGAFSVWQARSGQIPNILLEIGRLREISFRRAGEGTGRSFDLDRFDAHYLHLFIWNEASVEVVGAYRLGLTDEILAAMGKKGLYTSTLFRSRMVFFQKLGPALEMGRSFIRPEYQKAYASLLLLWKGIGAFVARHPEYRMLFGPVSISSDYSDLSRRLMATTLLQHSQTKDLAMMVRPRKPVRLNPIRVRGCSGTTRDIAFQDFKEVCSVVGDIEIGQKEVPVLLRQYLNLGGQLLCFNIDRSFSNVMDGLIVVDLLQTDRKTLERYMGPQGVSAFISHHTSQKGSLGRDPIPIAS